MSYKIVIEVLISLFVVVFFAIVGVFIYIYNKFYKPEKMPSEKDLEEEERKELLRFINQELIYVNQYTSIYQKRYDALEKELNKFRLYDRFHFFQKALFRYTQFTSNGVDPNMVIGEYKFVLNKINRCKDQIQTLLDSKEKQLHVISKHTTFVKNFLLMMDRLRKNALAKVTQHGLDKEMLRDDIYFILKKLSTHDNLYDFYSQALKLDEAYKRIIKL